MAFVISLRVFHNSIKYSPEVKYLKGPDHNLEWTKKLSEARLFATTEEAESCLKRPDFTKNVTILERVWPPELISQGLELSSSRKAATGAINICSVHLREDKTIHVGAEYGQPMAPGRMLTLEEAEAYAREIGHVTVIVERRNGKKAPQRCFIVDKADWVERPEYGEYLNWEKRVYALPSYAELTGFTLVKTVSELIKMGFGMSNLIQPK